MTVYCEDCDNIHPLTAKDAPWRQRCIMVKLGASGFGFVSRAYSPSPPYALCNDVNETGHCEMFTPRRQPKEKAA